MEGSENGGGALPFTPKDDKRIIEEFLRDPASMMKELTEAGFSRRAILERARYPGMTDNFIKQCRLSGLDVAWRSCLRCDQMFASMGPHNDEFTFLMEESVVESAARHRQWQKPTGFAIRSIEISTVSREFIRWLVAQHKE